MSTLDALIKQVNKDHKQELIVVGASPKSHLSLVPFSSPRANYMLYGGLPLGRIVEFAGEEGGGKTTTALDIVANAQKVFQSELTEEVAKIEKLPPSSMTPRLVERLKFLKQRGPRRVFYADCENTLDDEWAELLGVDIAGTFGMVKMKPQSETAEEIFQMVLDFIDTGDIGLVVIDSLGVMLSAAAYEKDMEGKTMGGIAAALTLFSKKAEMACARQNCLLIGINQMREDMNSPYGGLITTGGKAWKHNCSIRLLFQKGPYIDEKSVQLTRSAESPSGNLVQISIAKTKVCKPNRRTGFYTLRYETGIDVVADTVETGVKFDLIMQAGSWFTLVTPEGEVRVDEAGNLMKFQGKASLADFLADNVKILEDLISQINVKIGE